MRNKMECTRCGDGFLPYAGSNPHQICRDCANILESLAEIEFDADMERQSRVADNCRASPEDEYMCRPGSRRYSIQRSTVFVRSVEE